MAVIQFVALLHADDVDQLGKVLTFGPLILLTVWFWERNMYIHVIFI